MPAGPALLAVYAAMDKLIQTHFAMMDALRRAQAEALGLLGFGPAECSYQVIASGPHWLLRKYSSSASRRPPLLIVAAPIKRPYIWDLAPHRSIVRLCLDQPLSVYLLEWLAPAGEAQGAGLADYAGSAISQCVAIVRNEPEGQRPFLAGHSLGGTLAAIYCALEPQSARGLVLVSAPLCFAPESSQFRDALVSLLPPRLLADGPVPGSLLSHASAMASPGSFVWARLRDALLSSQDPSAMDIHSRVERWALDEVPLPGPLIIDIIQMLYREDRFFKGSLSIRDQQLGPSRLCAPVLAIVNAADEVVPLATVKPFLDSVPGNYARIIEYPGEAGAGLQHLAALSGAQAHARIWPQVFTWLQGLS